VKVYNKELDGSPDAYFFNFAGQSGQIFFARNNTGSPYKYTPYTKPQQDDSIRVVTDSNNRIASWVITTSDGTQYTFAQPETSSLTAGGVTVYSAITSWYLTKITSATGSDTITLTYQSGATTIDSTTSYTAFNVLPNNQNSACVPSDYMSWNYSGTSSIYLSKIETASQTANFTLGSRSDGGGNRLVSIEIESPSGSIIHQYVLEHGYYNAGLSEVYHRLRLDSLQQFGSNGVQLPSWKFSYDNSYALPARTSWSQDYWGYFNGATNSELAPEVVYQGVSYGSGNRDPDPLREKTGVLTKITYPTGGTTSFTYEGNRYGSNNTLGGGIRIKQIVHHDGMSSNNDFVIKYLYTDASGNSTGVLLQDLKFYEALNYPETFYPGGWATPEQCNYLTRSSTSYISPGVMQGSVVLYKEVTVERGANGEGGKKVAYYNVPSLTNYQVRWPYTPSIVESWRGGNVTDMTEFNSNGATQEDQSFNYTSSNEKSIKGIVVGAY